MSILVFLFVTASTLTILCSGENAPICGTEDNTHGTLFVAQDTVSGTAINVLSADLSTSSPSIVQEFTKTSTVPRPSQVTLSTEGVSDLQHERVVVTSTSIVTLTQDALVIVASEDGQTIVLPIDASCKPQRLYTRNANEVIYILCRDRSRVLKLASDSSSGYQLTEIEWNLDDGVHSPAVAFSPGKHVAAAVLKHTYDENDDFHYNWIEIKQNIDIDTPSVVCDDAYYIDPSCDNAEDRLLPFNETHLIIECSQTKQFFLLDILSLVCSESKQVGITSLELKSQVTGTAVGPDKDAFVVNYGTYVYVQIHGFKQSYVCDAGQQIVRFDYVATDYIVLFTAAGIFSCNSGVVTQLSLLSLSKQFSAYFIDNVHLFVATSSLSTAITVFNVENACQFQFNTKTSISISPGPLQLHVLAFIEGPSPGTANPNVTPSQSMSSTPAVTSLAVTSVATSPVGTTPSLPINLIPFYAAAIVASIISLIVVAGILTFCMVRLCRKCRQTKPGSSPELGMARSPSIASSSTSVNSGIQETVANPPIPASSSQYSISWTFRPSWDNHLTTPIPETRPLVEQVLANSITYQSPVRSELYLTVPLQETHQCIFAHPATEL